MNLILSNFFDTYFVQNYVLLAMLAGMMILTVFDVFLERKALIRLRFTLAAILVLSLFEYFEECYASLPTPTNWRILYSALCYSLRPLIILMIIFSIFRRVPKWTVIPAIINMLVVFSAFFTDIAFTFSSDNSFIRGTLGYVPHIVSGLYLLFLLYLSIRTLTRNSLEEHSAVFYIGIVAVGAGFLSTRGHDEVVLLTYAACVLLYYLFTYELRTKKDALTGLLNRQSLYHWTEQKKDLIKGVISIDMNELKWLNDNFGHEKGDSALAAVSACFLSGISVNELAFRVGGDEFIILSRKGEEEYLNGLVEKIRKAVDETGYSCAFGFSSGAPVEDMIREADRLMYEDKAKIKAQMAQDGKILHNRE